MGFPWLFPIWRDVYLFAWARSLFRRYPIESGGRLITSFGRQGKNSVAQVGLGKVRRAEDEIREHQGRASSSSSSGQDCRFSEMLQRYESGLGNRKDSRLGWVEAMMRAVEDLRATTSLVE